MDFFNFICSYGTLNVIYPDSFIKRVHVTPVVLISFEAWAKLAQKWLVCAPLGIHFEPINKELILLVTI